MNSESEGYRFIVEILFNGYEIAIVLFYDFHIVKKVVILAVSNIKTDFFPLFFYLDCGSKGTLGTSLFYTYLKWEDNFEIFTSFHDCSRPVSYFAMKGGMLPVSCIELYGGNYKFMTSPIGKVIYDFIECGGEDLSESTPLVLLWVFQFEHVACWFQKK